MAGFEHDENLVWGEYVHKSHRLHGQTLKAKCFFEKVVFKAKALCLQTSLQPQGCIMTCYMKGESAREESPMELLEHVGRCS